MHLIHENVNTFLSDVFSSSYGTNLVIFNQNYFILFFIWNIFQKIEYTWNKKKASRHMNKTVLIKGWIESLGGGVDSLLESWMMCTVEHEIKPPTYKIFL